MLTMISFDRLERGGGGDTTKEMRGRWAAMSYRNGKGGGCKRVQSHFSLQGAGGSA